MAGRPVDAAEMVLIRIAHAANLPTLDEALKSLETGAASNSPVPTGGNNPRRCAVARRRWRSGDASCSGASRNRPLPRAPPRADANPQPSVTIASLEDIAALAETHRDIAFKVTLRRCVRLVKLEPGRLDVSLTGEAPKTFLGDLSAKLLAWTGLRWIVSLSREEGGATLAEEEAGRRELVLIGRRAPIRLLRRSSIVFRERGSLMSASSVMKSRTQILMRRLTWMPRLWTIDTQTTDTKEMFMRDMMGMMKQAKEMQAKFQGHAGRNG